MRVNGPLYLSTCFLAGVSAAYGFAPAKLPASARTTSAGVKTPGVQIPMASLKAEAEILLEAPAESVFVNAESAFVATKSQLLPLNLKTNKLDPVIAALKTPCSNMVNAFRSTSGSELRGIEDRPLGCSRLEVTASVAVPILAKRQSVVASPDSVWVLSDEKSTLARLDPDENKIVAEVRLPSGCNSLLFAETALWVTCASEDKVLRIDPATNLVTKRVEVPAKPVSLAFGEGSVWALCKTEGKVVRIDPKTNKSTTNIELKTPEIGGEIAFGEGFVWVSSPGFPVTRIDPANDKVAQQFTGVGGGRIYVGSGSIWIPDLKANTVSRFDPKRIKATLAE